MQDFDVKSTRDLKSPRSSESAHADDVTTADRAEFAVRNTRSIPPGESEDHSAILRRLRLHPSSAARYVLQLQRQYGNRYVQRVIALTRSEAHEQEITPSMESTIERGRELLSHDLTRVAHLTRVAQQGGSTVQSKQVQGQLLQRAPHSRSQRPKASAKPPIDDATASRDYTDANTYLLQFYAGVHFALELNDKVRVAAQANYERFGKLTDDPPSLPFAILKSVFSTLLAQVPGGAIISAGLEMGMFANDLGKLKLELEEHPIPGYTVEDEERIGPSAESKEKAKKGSEHIKTGWEGAEKVYEAIKDTLEKQKAAAEAETEALESAGLRQERIADWAQATGRAQREEQTVTQWVRQAGEKKHLRGGMLAAVKAHLGPILIIDESTHKALEKRYELELYRAKYQAAGRYVRTVIYGGGLRDSDPTEPELRVSGGLSQATRRRIAECAGVTATDDETMVKVLGISTTTERMRNPGLKQPGES